MDATVEVDGTTARRTGRRLMAVALVAAVLAACAPTGGSAPGSYPDKATLEFVKRTEFYDRARNEADRIAAGVAQPVLEFTVEGSPPSVFVNWIVPDAQAAAFSSFVALPPGFSLAKVRIIEGDPVARYWLSLNVYRVSGLTTGLRAEWSTYVDDGSGVPRFMIIRARAAEGSLDPIGPIAQPEPFSHGLGTDGVIRTAMNRTVLVNSVPVVTADNLFNSSITLPAPVDRNYVVPTREWVTANDFIYWRNGVNDRIFHNSTSHSAPLISVALADVVLDDDSEWAPFVDPVPGHVLVYLDRIQFMIGPWWNVTEPDGRVDPGTRATLFDYKKSLYGGLSSVLALGVLAGTAEPIVSSTVADTPPATYWHWRVPPDRLAAFTAAAHVPPWLTLTTVQLQDGDAADHWLTLKVDRDPATNAGLRAEWSTYVNDGGRIHTLLLESRSGFTSLDPINLATPPYPVSHAIAGTTVTTTVGTGATAFSSSFVVPAVGPGTTVLASREWVGASDLRYWMSGVADRVFYDSTVFDAKTSVDPGGVTVTDGGPWAAFVAGGPDRVWVDRSGADFVTNPWWNLSFF